MSPLSLLDKYLLPDYIHLLILLSKNFNSGIIKFIFFVFFILEFGHGIGGLRNPSPSAGHKDILQYFLLTAHMGRGGISLVFLLAEGSGL